MGCPKTKRAKQIEVTDPAGAVLTNIYLWGSEGEGYNSQPLPYQVSVHLERPATTPRRNFHLTVMQFREIGEVYGANSGVVPDASASGSPLDGYMSVGGITYEIRP